MTAFKTENRGLQDAMPPVKLCRQRRLSLQQNTSHQHVVRDKFLTVKQAAEHLNVGKKTIYAACQPNAKHVLKHARIGQGRGTIRINRSDLDDFTRKNSVQVSGPRDYLSE